MGSSPTYSMLFMETRKHGLEVGPPRPLTFLSFLTFYLAIFVLYRFHQFYLVLLLMIISSTAVLISKSLFHFPNVYFLQSMVSCSLSFSPYP